MTILGGGAQPQDKLRRLALKVGAELQIECRRCFALAVGDGLRSEAGQQFLDAFVDALIGNPLLAVPFDLDFSISVWRPGTGIGVRSGSFDFPSEPFVFSLPDFDAGQRRRERRRSSAEAEQRMRSAAPRVAAEIRRRVGAIYLRVLEGNPEFLNAFLDALAAAGSSPVSFSLWPSGESPFGEEDRFYIAISEKEKFGEFDIAVNPPIVRSGNLTLELHAQRAGEDDPPMGRRQEPKGEAAALAAIKVALANPIKRDLPQIEIRTASR